MESARQYQQIKQLPTEPSFKYLGTIFRPEGIDWVAHFDRLEGKAERIARWFRSLPPCPSKVSSSAAERVSKHVCIRVQVKGIQFIDGRDGIGKAFALVFGCVCESVPASCDALGWQ